MAPVPKLVYYCLIHAIRRQEADHYGLIFAAMAGYNPEEAIPFWKRMQSMAGGRLPLCS